MMTYTLFLGAFMFIHYGCAILKHRPKESDIFLKLALLLKLICAVLVVRASIDVNYWDLLVAFIIFSTCCLSLNFYSWAHGATFIELGARLKSIRFKDIIQSIKDTL
jgi:hypothetical protein